MLIENGKGGGNYAGVNSENQLLTFSIIESESQHAASRGELYNLNTGYVSILSLIHISEPTRPY